MILQSGDDPVPVEKVSFVFDCPDDKWNGGFKIEVQRI
jgi:hypothetical protein